MPKTAKPPSRSRLPGTVEKGYQPKPFTESSKPQGGHQPTSQGAPAKPPSNAPNQASGGKGK